MAMRKLHCNRILIWDDVSGDTCHPRISEVAPISCTVVSSCLKTQADTIAVVTAKVQNYF